MTDPRVRHVWDKQKVLGNWYSASVLHRDGTTWDFYAVYGPEATWGSGTATSSEPGRDDHHASDPAADCPLAAAAHGSVMTLGRWMVGARRAR